MATTVLGKRSRVNESRKAFTTTRRTRQGEILIHQDGPVETDNCYKENEIVSQVEDSDRCRSYKRRCQASNRSTRDSRSALSESHGNRQNAVERRCSKRELSLIDTFERGISENEDIVLQLPTPKTPRHRDALSKKVPVTPRHRVGLVGKPLTPRSSHTPSSSEKSTSIFAVARQLFTRNTDPGRIVGRSQERAQLKSFVQANIKHRLGGSMYISGPPGTGKSALVSEVCNELKSAQQASFAHINCMGVKRSADLYDKLAVEFLDDDILNHSTSLDKTSARIRSLLGPSDKAVDHIFVVVLDEVDHLLTLDSDVLYTLFDWSLQRGSPLIVIGIANALDLTDRFLPLLKARNLKPNLLPFLPYTAAQIAEVVTSKLRSLIADTSDGESQAIPFFQPAAIQLCSKKVASQTGDLRKAFDIVRRSLDVVELETKQKSLSDVRPRSFEDSPSKQASFQHTNDGLSSSSLSAAGIAESLVLKDLTPMTAPRVTIAHVSRVSASMFSNGANQRLQTLHLQQKAALCSLLYHERQLREVHYSPFSTPSKQVDKLPPTIRKLHETYCGLCKRENLLHPLTVTEFADVLNGLETLGLVSENGKGRLFATTSTTMVGNPSWRKRKSASNCGAGAGGLVVERRMISLIGEDEVMGCLNGPGGDILKGLLRD